MLVLAAPDKFRGTASGTEVARAICEGARLAGIDCRLLPLADGGEGTLDALGGANRTAVVSGPLGGPVTAGWRLETPPREACIAIIEAARASGLNLAGGPERNDAVRASSRGTGELIAAALAAGAGSIVVGLGGSATTDGGIGAVEALGGLAFPVPVRVACDVRTAFLDAATVFGPQKGATPAEVALLSERLRDLARLYDEQYGVDVASLAGAGAAGGLAGGLAALGAELVPGFELVAEQVGLARALDGVELVVTGEGKLDATSFDGKVVGGVLAACVTREIPVIVVVGEIEPGTECPVPAVSLVEQFGRGRALAEPAACVTEAIARALLAWPEPT